MDWSTGVTSLELFITFRAIGLPVYPTSLKKPTALGPNPPAETPKKKLGKQRRNEKNICQDHIIQKTSGKDSD